MDKYIITNSTGQVLSIQEPAFDNAITEGWDGDIFVKQVAAGSDNTELLTQYFWNFETETLDLYPSLKPSAYHDWDGTAWVKDAVKFVRQLKIRRNALLKESDWTQIPDSPLTTEQQAVWATYRQELRDITDNLIGSETTIEDAPWPSAP